MNRSIAVVAALGLAACSSKSNDMENVCFAAERSRSSSIANPGERAVKTAEWIEANVHDKGLLKEIHSLAAVDGDKGAILREFAKERG